MAITFESREMNSLEDYSSRVEFSFVDLPKSPMDIDDDFEDLDVLCQLVRNRYLNRLHQTLLENLGKCQKKNDPHITQCVDICMAEMEKRALRRCMIASIYGQDMSSMINKVKTSTQNSMLYVLLQNIIESENQTHLWDKYFGAVNKTKQSIHIGINTEQKSNEKASTQTENMIVSKNNSTNNISNHLFSKCTVTLNAIKSHLPLSSSEEKSNEFESEIIFENLNTILSSSSSPSHSPREVNINVTEDVNPQQSLEPNNCIKNDILSINALLRDLQDSPEFEQQSPRLDDSLINVGLESKNQNAMDVSEVSKPIFVHKNTLRSKKINKIHGNKLKCERIAKEYELMRSMKDIPRALRSRLNDKFDQLFGRDHDYDTDPLSEEEQHIVAHKRIVKLVVQYMTPYYNEQRISRRMFKSLAKIISKTFMDRSYDPDEEAIRKGVSEFFTENRCIKRYEDIYN